MYRVLRSRAVLLTDVDIDNALSLGPATLRSQPCETGGIRVGSRGESGYNLHTCVYVQQDSRIAAPKLREIPTTARERRVAG